MFDTSDFWTILWGFFWVFAFIAYLSALFSVITDLFRDHQLSGGWKALWVFFLVFVPFLTVLVYLIARGRGMQERAERATRQMQAVVDDYRRTAAPASSAADEIAKAKSLADDGTISAQEFEQLKSRALGA
ncbi:PLDc N-terminal domain-containing protein [Rathayibacter oskolensis]|uniref:PLDc N-terminal domain-containing protein n=1 Tax=Rathayibacter oskolensis TaxID=1891671 RepID=UPI00265FA9A9|nr:PLDc N-terminal domain-containing protein [Rathayibacter oskolensis]WKK72572.1 PLDc N-terminal domain-containing protein [Rathayibacter oskolensis]